MIPHRLLVPLDGSALSETAVPLAIKLASRLDASVLLLHVVERSAPASVHGDRHLTDVGSAVRYLNEVAARVGRETPGVETHVHAEPEGDVAASIAAHLDEYAADLIVMSTHGRGGLRGWIVGGIAQQVVRHGGPLVLVRPNADGTVPATIGRVLVALDGTATHEEVLPLAAAIARVSGVALDLLIVVPTLATISLERAVSATFLPSATAAVLDIEARDAEDYLEGIAGRMAAQGVPVSTQVRRGDPASEIAAAATDGTLLGLATHGRYGLSGMWAGSVAAKVLARTQVPVLLVPVR